MSKDRNCVKERKKRIFYFKVFYFESLSVSLLKSTSEHYRGENAFELVEF